MMAMMWKYIFVSGLLFTSSQYLNLGEKDECDSNENIMEKLQTLVNQQSKLQHEIDRLKNDKEELRVLLTNCSSTNDQTRSLDCSDIYNSGQTKTGVYKIYPFGENNRAVSVICEMDSPGGGCTVIQKRHRENPRVNFNTYWDEYKRGFGNVRGNYWLGNDAIHKLTSLFPNHLYMRMKSTSNQSFEVKYTSFSISDEADGYRFSLGRSLGSIGDAFQRYSPNQKFSTFDKDNSNKCGAKCKSGWWFDSCTWTNLNAPFLNIIKILSGIHPLTKG